MKVMYLTNLPSPYRVDFFNELGKSCDLTVCFERRSAKDREKSWLSRELKHFKAIFLKSAYLGNENSFSLDAINQINKEKFDVILIGGYSTLTAMLTIIYLKIKRIPFILNADGGIIKKESRVKFKIKRYFISSASFWLCSGKETKKYFEFYGAESNRIGIFPFTSIRKKEIIQQPITIKQKEKIKKRLGIREEKIILSIGQFIPRKGFDILLKASKNLGNETGVYIIGGKPTDEYLSYKKDLNLKKVYFLDFLPKEILKDYYMASDLFVLPTREDIWGLVINEAMANGLPIITSNKCNAGLELVENEENGFIVKSNNQAEYEEKIKLILEDDILKKKMSCQSIEKINEYTIEKMAEKKLKILSEWRKVNGKS